MTTPNVITAFQILQPGILSLFQDRGRFGHAHLGLTNGGPADTLAFDYANSLLNNAEGSTAIEITAGGMKLQCEHDCQIAITGAKADISLNNVPAPQWTVLTLHAGDNLDIGYTQDGCRLYLAIRGGFHLTPQLGSTATVIREGIGGYDGTALRAGQRLFSLPASVVPEIALDQAAIPTYPKTLNLRVIAGYQFEQFDALQRARFFNSGYTVTKQADRMGYRLSGTSIAFPSRALYSEGICTGAIQIPPDGQPIVLGVDKQTIGGYPKIGTLLSLDLSRLMQASQGVEVRFTAISIEDANGILALHRARRNHFIPCR